MNSESQTEAEKVLERIRFLLDPEKIEREIESPIDRVLESFHCEQPTVFSQESFHQVIGDFVRLLYRKGLRIPKELSRSEAVAEAIHILEQGYQGQNTTGYGVAFYDAADGEQKGINYVVVQMAELVKKAQRQQYVRWVLGTAPPEFDWRTKCQIVQFLAKSLSPFLSPSIHACPPSQLADQWRELLFLYLDTDRALEHYSSEPMFFPGG